MKSKKLYPLSLKRDSVTVKICRADSKGFAEFTLAHREQGRRIRRAFTDEHDAKQEAGRVLTRLCQGAADVLTLRGSEKLEHVRAKQALAGLDLPLDVVALEWARFHRELNGRGAFSEAVNYYLKTHAHIRAVRRVDEVVKELLETRKKDGSSQRHVDDLESDVGLTSGV
jgi:hypothetical protein